jgi:RimJ/RimL family protein N-acetyltransferase
METKFVDFDRKFLELSWIWLNDPENKFLTNSTDLKKENQMEWFNSLHKRKDYLIWGVTFDNIPVGAAGLKKIIDETAYVFWYIGEKRFQGKRIGEQIAKNITDISRDLGIKTLFAETIFENFRSVNLLFKEGYKIVSVEKGLYLVKKEIL